MWIYIELIGRADAEERNRLITRLAATRRMEQSASAQRHGKRKNARITNHGGIRP